MSSIQRWAEDTDECLFASVDISRRRGWSSGRRQHFGPLRKGQGGFLTIEGSLVVGEGGIYGEGIHFSVFFFNEEDIDG